MKGNEVEGREGEGRRKNCKKGLVRERGRKRKGAAEKRELAYSNVKL